MASHVNGSWSKNTPKHRWFLKMRTSQPKNTDTPEVKQRYKSPPYPCLDLKETIRRAGLLHMRFQTSEVSLDQVAQAWEMPYSGKPQGKFPSYVATLRYYGLVEESGRAKERRIKLTSLARALIKHNHPAASFLKKKAAENPQVLLEVGQLGATDPKEIIDYLTTRREDVYQKTYSRGAAKAIVQIWFSNNRFIGLEYSGKRSDIGHPVYKGGSASANASEQHPSEKRGPKMELKRKSSAMVNDSLIMINLFIEGQEFFLFFPKNANSEELDLVIAFLGGAISTLELIKTQSSNGNNNSDKNADYRESDLRGEGTFTLSQSLRRGREVRLAWPEDANAGELELVICFVRNAISITELIKSQRAQGHNG